MSVKDHQPMSPTTPYTYLQCPCSDLTSAGRRPGAAGVAATTATSSTTGAAAIPPGQRDAGENGEQKADDEDDDDDDDDGRTFDPRAPRSAYGLYPIEYLMYCEDCQQIRCQRCVNEEIVAYYCPNCLFEVPSSNIKSEGNRCTRSCFQCPVCLGPMTGHAVENNKPRDTDLLAPPPGSGPSPSSDTKVVFTCNYCNWCTAEVGLVFDKGGAFNQLARMANGGGRRRTAREHRDRRKEDADEPPVPDAEVTAELQFAHLKAFYGRQLSSDPLALGGGTNAGVGGGLPAGLGDLGFSSPTTMSRIMNIYAGGGLGGGAGANGKQKQQGRVPAMREARGTDEGLVKARLDEREEIKMVQQQQQEEEEEGGDEHRDSKKAWEDTPSLEQRTVHNEPWRAAPEYRPVPMLLRTKRSKRCPACRHIITKPEAKVANVRYRIRLVASHYVPSIAIKPMMMQSSSSSTAVPATSRTSSSSRSSSAMLLAQQQQQRQLLTPGKPVQFILTFTNPIFEPVKVTLGAPSATPGRFPSKVTLLCPQFTIDKNTDMWDDALRDDGDKGSGGNKDGGGGGGGGAKGSSGANATGGGGGDAGKIWDRGRNWVSVVVELVPASLRLDGLRWAKEQGADDVDDGPLKEDEDVLEVPMFVRVEWEAETAETGHDKNVKEKPREKRELAYWCVLGMGKISQD